MREIKFKAWHKSMKEMIHSDNRKIFINFAGVPCSGGDAGTLRSPEPYFPWYRGDHYILMQYTGLKDKNGKEIYEGDILICSNIPESQDISFEVYYSNEKACFDLKRGANTTTSFLLSCNTLYEIIGNIHENPELLESHPCPSLQ